MNFKNIHIGELIKTRVSETGIEIARICNFLNCKEDDVRMMYKEKSMDSDRLLRWSKLLDYDLFRVYSQHLILFAPQGNTKYKSAIEKKSSNLPQFRKNIYTKEVIDFILKLISKKEKTVNQIITEYRIPKTTLYKWINKYEG